MLNEPPRDLADAISAYELSHYMRNQLLRDSDWAGMAHSLEIRVPYLDVSFFRSLAPLISGARVPVKKADLARALKPPLPDEMVRRAKTGFTIPVREWCIDMFGRQVEARGIRGWDSTWVGQPSHSLGFATSQRAARWKSTSRTTR